MSRLKNSGRYDSLDAVSLPTLSDFPWAELPSPTHSAVQTTLSCHTFHVEFETSLRCYSILDSDFHLL